MEEENIIENNVIEESLEDVIAERDSWKTKYTYMLADLDNFKKRNIKEKESSYNKGVEKTILTILPVLDDFERAFNHNELAEGGKLIYKKLVDAIKTLGVERIEIGEDADFNVDEHEAVSMIGGNNKIKDEVLAGYKMNGKVIRYSKVIVG